MVRTSATRPIVVVPPTQPGIELSLPRETGASKPRGSTSPPLPIPRKRPSLYCWPRAMAHAAFVHSKPVRIMTSLTLHIPETVDEDWPR